MKNKKAINNIFFLAICFMFSGVCLLTGGAKFYGFYAGFVPLGCGAIMLGWNLMELVKWKTNPYKMFRVVKSVDNMNTVYFYSDDFMECLTIYLRWCKPKGYKIEVTTIAGRVTAYDDFDNKSFDYQVIKTETVVDGKEEIVLTAVK